MTDAEKRETVIRGLERFIDDFKPFCGNRDDWQRVYDALALLKEQDKQLTMAKNLLETIADQDTNWTTYIRYHLTWQPPKEEEDA